MACFGEFMPHRIAGGGRKGKVHKDNIRVQFCMLYFAWEQHLFLLSFSSEVKPRGPPARCPSFQKNYEMEDI